MSRRDEKSIGKSRGGRELNDLDPRSMPTASGRTTSMSRTILGINLAQPCSHFGVVAAIHPDRHAEHSRRPQYPDDLHNGSPVAPLCVLQSLPSLLSHIRQSGWIAAFNYSARRRRTF
jgi:hypothetical protein